MAGTAVAMVLDRQFGRRLNELREFDAVWIVASPVNNPFVTALRAERQVSRVACEITTWTAPPDEPILEFLLSQAKIVDLHHPRWDYLEVFGSPRSPVLTELFTALGAAAFDDTEDGFAVRRPTPPRPVVDR